MEKERAVAESGLTPLDYMLTILRDTTAEPDQRFEAAKAAAPYVHPRLSNIDANVQGKVGLTVEVIRFADTE